MTPDEFEQLGKYAVGLWPAWKPTPEQMDAWFSALKHRTLADAKSALLAGFTVSKWREPNLPDVLAGLPKLPANYATAIDEEATKQLFEADLAMKRRAAGLPVRGAKRTAPLAEQAAIVREEAQRARRMVGQLQQALDDQAAQFESRRKELQKALDEVRKFASETLAQADALSLDMKAAALAEEVMDQVVEESAV